MALTLWQAKSRDDGAGFNAIKRGARGNLSDLTGQAGFSDRVMLCRSFFIAKKTGPSQERAGCFVR